MRFIIFYLLCSWSLKAGEITIPTPEPAEDCFSSCFRPCNCFKEKSSSACCGFCNSIQGESSEVLYGCCNHINGSKIKIAGSCCNSAQGLNSKIKGSCCIKAYGPNSSVDWALCSEASGQDSKIDCCSSCNIAANEGSTVDGCCNFNYGSNAQIYGCCTINFMDRTEVQCGYCFIVTNKTENKNWTNNMKKTAGCCLIQTSLGRSCCICLTKSERAEVWTHWQKQRKNNKYQAIPVAPIAEVMK